MRRHETEAQRIARKATAAAYRLRNRDEILAKQAAYRQQHAEAIREKARVDAAKRAKLDPDYQRKWLAAHPEVRSKYNVARNVRLKARRAAARAIREQELQKHATELKAARELREKQTKAAYAARPEVKARTQAQLRARYAEDPLYNLKRRMSSAVRVSLSVRGAAGKPWQSRWLHLVGYSSDDLRGHIERQFLPKMGWHNMPKWHIDHIVPLASFRFSSHDDPEFKAAWALTNLRPVWATVNLRKQAKREHLL
jgi:hypothetical protein